MCEWQTIESAPTNGTVVRLRREYKGRIVKEGLGFCGPSSPKAPRRAPPDSDPLNRPGNILAMADLHETQEERDARCDQRLWHQEDGMYLFPTPTHWKPANQGPSG